MKAMLLFCLGGEHRSLKVFGLQIRGLGYNPIPFVYYF